MIKKTRFKLIYFFWKLQKQLVVVNFCVKYNISFKRYKRLRDRHTHFFNQMINWDYRSVLWVSKEKHDPTALDILQYLENYEDNKDKKNS